MGRPAQKNPGEAKERQRLRHLLVLMSGAFELSAVPFAAATPEGEILAFNRAFCELTGYDAEQMARLNVIEDLTPLSWRDTLRQARERLSTTGAPQRYERELNRRDGSTLPVELFLHQANDDQGKVHYYWSVFFDISERKRNEAQVRDSEARYRAMLEAFDGYIYVCGPDHTVQFMNEAMIERTGRDARGEKCFEVLHGREDICPWCVNERVFKGERVSWEVQSPKDGRWWYVVNTPIHHADGTISKQSMIQDVTARKQAEAALKESQRRMADLINFLPDPTLAVDRQGVIIAWNLAMEELTGLRSGQMLGKGNHEYALPFYGERRPVLVDLALRQEEDQERLYPLLVRDSHTLTSEVFVPDVRPGGMHLWAKATPLFDAQGQVIGAIESVRDITPRKLMEQALRESAEKHQALVRSLPVGVITLDAEHRVTELNTQGEAITGYTQAEALGKHCWDVMQDGKCELQCPLKSSARRGGPVGPIETTLFNRKIGRIPVRISAAQVTDAQGRVVGAVEVFQDISEIKALERERSNIVSMFAHDMKSPLVSIQGFALRLLSEAVRESPDKRDKYLEIIRKEAGKLEALINDFLDFARLETGSLHLNFSATDLDKEFLELTEVFQPRFLAAGIDLRLVAGEKLPVIHADASRLRRVFTNLLENALKYSGPGTEVSLEPREQGEEIRVTVRDQGIGIAPEELPKVFDVFYRSRSQEKREGHGLGLAGVEAIVKGHGGRVSVTSQVGKGSTFTVVLPKKPPAPSHAD
jgi:PAS domain S-box-containing protein